MRFRVWSIEYPVITIFDDPQEAIQFAFRFRYPDHREAAYALANLLRGGSHSFRVGEREFVRVWAETWRERSDDRARKRMNDIMAEVCTEAYAMEVSR